MVTSQLLPVYPSWLSCKRHTRPSHGWRLWGNDCVRSLLGISLCCSPVSRGTRPAPRPPSLVGTKSRRSAADPRLASRDTWTRTSFAALFRLEGWRHSCPRAAPRWFRACSPRNRWFLWRCGEKCQQPRSQALSSHGGCEMKEPGNEVEMSHVARY